MNLGWCRRGLHKGMFWAVLPCDGLSHGVLVSGPDTHKHSGYQHKEKDASVHRQTFLNTKDSGIWKEVSTITTRMGSGFLTNSPLLKSDAND